MARELMCQYGNCTDDVKDGDYAVRVTITANHNGSRVESPVFCCYAHASLWLANQAPRVDKAKLDELNG